MASYTITLAPEVKQPDGTATIRMRAAGGKYVTLVVQDGETLTATDPALVAAIESFGARVVTPLAVKPTKPTHDADTAPKEDLPTGTKTATAGAK